MPDKRVTCFLVDGSFALLQKDLPDFLDCWGLTFASSDLATWWYSKSLPVGSSCRELSCFSATEMLPARMARRVSVSLSSRVAEGCLQISS